MIAKITNNAVSTKHIQIPATSILPSTAVIKDIRPIINEATKETEFIRYELIDPKDFGTFKIKVAGAYPVITQEQLEKSEAPVYLDIPLDKCEIKPYKIEYGKVFVSITCPMVRIHKEVAKND